MLDPGFHLVGANHPQPSTPPSSLAENAPEKWCLEDDPFLLGFGNFSGANC